MPEHINLRGDPGDGAFLAAVEGVVGFGLPRAANTVSTGAAHVAYWLGPDEWLLATDDAAALASRLRAALAGMFAAVTEVGGGNEVMVLPGASAREQLAAECPLDLHPDAFRSGQCAQTRFAQAVVLLRPLDNGDLELIVRRSFAAYVREHLSHSYPPEAA
jgi:sarcosine oxidase subunit gamma